MQSASALPVAVAELLRAFPYDFLYGSIAADTSMAKKYAPVGRHCHAWHVGLEIYDRAVNGPLRAFGLGYLAHLAADAVAHNYFVPRQLALTSSTTALGHSYWESRFEGHLGERHAHRAVELLLLDHSRSDRAPRSHPEPDDLLNADQSPDLPWDGLRYRHRVVAAHRAARLGEQSVGSPRRQCRALYGAVVRLHHGLPPAPRPVRALYARPRGRCQLHLAKRVRRSALMRGGAAGLVEEVGRHFGLPPVTLPYARALRAPLYPAVLPSSNS